MKYFCSDDCSYLNVKCAEFLVNEENSWRFGKGEREDVANPKKKAKESKSKKNAKKPARKEKKEKKKKCAQVKPLVSL